MAKTFQTELEAQDMAFDLSNKLTKILPDNMVRVNSGRSLGGGFDVTLYFAVGKDKNEWANGIVHNDPAYLILCIYADEFTRSQIGYKLRKAGIPVISQKKKSNPEAMTTHIVNYFTKHGAAINALRGQ